MKVHINPAPSNWAELLKRPMLDTTTLMSKVAAILKEIESKGDEAVIAYTEQFDGVQLDALEVTPMEIEQAHAQLSDNLKSAIQTAKNNIAAFHKHQQLTPTVIETMPGVKCWRESRPIERVGLYIPGGTAPLFSTVLMLGVPAQLAGCKEIVLCSPPSKDGTLHPAIIYAAQLAGINKIFKIGGVQAIGAMAYGTAAVPAVYKIFGPGNQYVTAAKQLVNQSGISIDMPAGPSEVLVCADHTANPGFVAADLLSQAEHGVDSQVVLIAFEESFVNEVKKALDEQLPQLPRAAIAQKALENSVSIVVKDRTTALDLINEYAPEHLILSIDEVYHFCKGIINAGSIFMGNYTPESVGDYASGTNHTLPTNGFAKAYSGVSLDSFVKKITFQELTPKGLQKLGPAVEEMAAAEALEAHKNAVTIRLEALKTSENQ